MKHRDRTTWATIGPAPARPAVTARARGGTAKTAADNRIGQQSTQGRAASGQGFALDEARRLLCSSYPEEWDAIEVCCDGDPYARCPRGLAAALAMLNDEQVGAVHARLSRARARLRAWVGD
jgi:hypothetical protein